MSRKTTVMGCFLLLCLYPVAWTAPILRAGVLPLFGLSEISVLSGIVALWETDFFLAGMIVVFALLAPLFKILWMLARAMGWCGAEDSWILGWLGKLAMGEIFLVSIYITAIKGVGIGYLEVAWGLYLFSFCVLFSIALEQVSAP